jgi:hypothetical protein
MHLKNEQSEELYLLAKNMAEHNPDFAYIRESVFEKCNDRELAKEIVDQVRLVYYAKKRKSGLSKLGIGCILLILGFVLTVINYHSNESFSLVMYGFTSLGLLLLFWGLYDIFG